MTGDLRLVLVQTKYQLVATARNRRAVSLGVLLPAVLLVAFNSIFTQAGDSVDLAGTTVTAHAYFTGAMLTYAILITGFGQLAIGLVSQREAGQLKRLRGTPMPAWTFVAATLMRATVMVALMAAVLLAIGGIAYGVHISVGAVAEIALYATLGGAALCSLGIAATALFRNVDSASAGLPIVSVLISLISGIFVPIDQLPSSLEHVARLFPVYHLAAGIQTALGVGGDTSLHAGDLWSLLVWAAIGIVFAARRFRWEPQAVAA